MEQTQLMFPITQGISFDFLSGVPVLLIAFVSFSVIYAVISIVLIYHWSAYGMHSGKILFAEILFVAVSLFLFVLSFSFVNYS